ncbi:MAG TPA: cytochrome c biogenesis protein [Kofleriaceae bacterium]|jgi:heme exporter protein C
MNRAIPVLAVIAGLLAATTFYMAISYADFDAKLYFSQKIFFWHVPHAFMLFIATGMCGICSLIFLKTRAQKWDDRALAAAEVAVYFGAAVLATGMIWAKAAWDHWWVWENRLTMSLILWLVLVGYVIVRRYAGASGAQLAAGLSVFGTLGIPFVYFMVQKGDNHPQAGAKGNVLTLNGSMRITFWLAVLAFLMWFLTFVTMRIQSVRLAREVRELREKGLDAGILT